MQWQPIHDEGLDLVVVGATGMVGQVLLELLVERRFPVRRLRLCGGERSQSTKQRFAGRQVPVERTSADAFDGAQLVFFAATGELSRALGNEAVRRGAIVIDKSSSFRMHPEVPLVVPEINAEALEAHHGIIASPNCTTTGLVMAIEPLRRLAGLKSLVVTTFQAVSGAGRDATAELSEQRRALLSNTTPVARVLPCAIANNVVALCGDLAEDGYTTEEHKLLYETRKILALPELGVSMTAVRVPVAVGHSAAVLVETERPVDIEQAKTAYASFEGVGYVDSPEGPTAMDIQAKDQVLVGRLRRDFNPNRVWLWEVSNNLRKGAATNAIQIAEQLLKRGRLRLRPA